MKRYGNPVYQKTGSYGPTDSSEENYREKINGTHELLLKAPKIIHNKEFFNGIIIFKDLISFY
jgi:hypothetical protein